MWNLSMGFSGKKTNQFDQENTVILGGYRS